MNRKLIFDAAARCGADWNKPGNIAIMDAAIDAALAGDAAVVVAPVVQPVIVAQPGDPASMISVKLLKLVCSPRPDSDIEPWVKPLQDACRQFGMTRIRRVAAFIAQIAHESDLKARTENLNYSVEGLLRTFGRHRISREDCVRFGRSAAHPANQVEIANRIYGGEWGRINLGNTQPGDGWLFRGGGPLQGTGRANWTRFAKAMGMPLDQALAWGRTLEGGIMFAAWFWEENDINRLADTPGVTDESKKINGGTNGLADRKAKFDKLIDAMLRIEGGQPL
jgi:putative chitinase